MLEKILRRVPLMPEAACRGHAGLFDADRLEDAPKAAKALALCETCPALSQCERFAASLPHSRLRGVWAGALYLDPTNGAFRASEGAS